jgi:hypothetical protein
MVCLEVDNIKSLREALCVAQSAIGQAYGQRQTAYSQSKIDEIQKVLDQIDILRPLGPDGKHGDRHTEHCGCEDTEYHKLLSEWRVIPSFPMYELAGVGNIRVANNSNPEDPEEITARYGANGELEYDLCAIREGYLRTYSVYVRYLINETFPELKKEN